MPSLLGFCVCISYYQGKLLFFVLPFRIGKKLHQSIEWRAAQRLNTGGVNLLKVTVLNSQESLWKGWQRRRYWINLSTACDNARTFVWGRCVLPEQRKGSFDPCGSSTGESLLCRRRHLVLLVLIPHQGSSPTILGAVKECLCGSMENQALKILFDQMHRQWGWGFSPHLQLQDCGLLVTFLISKSLKYLGLCYPGV